MLRRSGRKAREYVCGHGKGSLPCPIPSCPTAPTVSVLTVEDKTGRFKAHRKLVDTDRPGIRLWTWVPEH